VLRTLYSSYLRTENPFLVMTPESAETTKYVANALLSTKISFINEMANLCEHVGADVNEVRRGIGHDSRIGFAFLFPGVGYGGSCFPKDVRALSSVARANGMDPLILDAVDAVNERQKHVLHTKIETYFDGDCSGRRIGIWGLAFKPRTDDIREAPALVLIDRLLELGASLCVHDPVAMENVQAHYGQRVSYASRPYDAIQAADALAINTEWDEYRNPDFARMHTAMKTPVVFDGRNLYSRETMRSAGFTYFSIGRPAVT
jgi:UDPglucose 6-dehydrogenase